MCTCSAAPRVAQSFKNGTVRSSAPFKVALLGPVAALAPRCTESRDHILLFFFHGLLSTFNAFHPEGCRLLRQRDSFASQAAASDRAGAEPDPTLPYDQCKMVTEVPDAVWCLARFFEHKAHMAAVVVNLLPPLFLLGRFHGVWGRFWSTRHHTAIFAAGSTLLYRTAVTKIPCQLMRWRAGRCSKMASNMFRRVNCFGDRA